MDENSSIRFEIFDVPTKKDLWATMLSIERREWWLWSSAVLVTLLLMVGIASFALSALLSQFDTLYAFFLKNSVRGLFGLVLIFNVYVVYEQSQINRIRRKLTEQAYKLAVLDPLTGLFNRRHIEQRLRDEIARSLRHGSPLTVILFDLDAFKQVNDRHGHAAGDGFLQAFAERLKRATRGSDVAARYGGDEFLVMLPECKAEDVQYVLKRLKGLHIENSGEKLPVLYSAGWTDYIPGESLAEFLKRADLALYANKRSPKAPLISPTVVGSS